MPAHPGPPSLHEARSEMDRCAGTRGRNLRPIPGLCLADCNGLVLPRSIEKTLPHSASRAENAT